MRVCLVLLAGIFLLLLINWLSMIVPPNPDIEKTVVIRGVVEAVEPSRETGDISFTLKNNKGFFYINRGLQAQIDPGALKELLVNKLVSIYIYNGGLNWFNRGPVHSGHICQVQLYDSVVYTEF